MQTVALPISDDQSGLTVTLKLELPAPATAELVLQALGVWGTHICLAILLVLGAQGHHFFALSSTPAGRQGRGRQKEKPKRLAPLAGNADKERKVNDERQLLFYERVAS